MFLDQAIKQFISYLANIERSKRTIDGYKLELDLFNRYLEKEWNCPVTVKDIVTADVENYLKYLNDIKGYKPASRRRALNTIRSFYKWAFNFEKVSKNITLQIEPITVPKQERCFLTENEVVKFIDAVEHDLVRVILWTLYYTGLRISECLALNLDDVDFKERKVHVRMGKGAKSRVIPMNEKLYEILKDYVLNWRPDVEEVFFATKKTGSISRNHVTRIVRETNDKLGWKKDVTPHVFRHSFATNLIKKKVALPHVSKLLGHSNLAITSVYTHSNMEDLAESVAVL